VAQFDVYQNNDPDSATFIPFLLDVQHDLHQNLASRSVVPLVSSFPADWELGKLCPRFEVMGRLVAMSTPEMAGYPAGELGRKVTTLADQRTVILAAIDFLLNGF
jgi:toxin CcdB